MESGPEVPGIFPSCGSLATVPPSLLGVARVRLPAIHAVLWGTPTSRRPSWRPPVFRLGLQYPLRMCFVRSSDLAHPSSRRPGPLLSGGLPFFRFVCVVGDRRDLPGSWETPLAGAPSSSTPVGPGALALTVARMLPSDLSRPSAPTTILFRDSITRLASLLAVYASRPGSLQSAQDSLPTCSLRFGRVGVSPTGFHH